MATPARNATSRSGTVVELTGVWKIYEQTVRSERLGEVLRNLVHPRKRRVEALRGIDLRVARGEIVAYAGPNGAGKSTTVKLLSGLLAPNAGTVRVLGFDPVRERTRYVERIGVVFGQRTELWWDHPVAASYAWKKVVWNVSDKVYQRNLGFLREVLGLDEFFHSLARELSLGQRMRADLGLALLHDPEVVFLDEPTLGLDVLAKRNILSFVKQLNRERQLTVMVTSHDMADLEELAGRIVMIHHGNIAYDGDFARLRQTVADQRRLSIVTSGPAPELLGATLVSSADGHHEYVFDANHVKIADLLAQASARAPILDVETHRASIDDVIADLYESWQGPGRT